MLEIDANDRSRPGDAIRARQGAGPALRAAAMRRHSMSRRSCRSPRPSHFPALYRRHVSANFAPAIRAVGAAHRAGSGQHLHAFHQGPRRDGRSRSIPAIASPPFWSMAISASPHSAPSLITMASAVLAFGHPLFNLGPVDMPLAKKRSRDGGSPASFQPTKIANRHRDRRCATAGSPQRHHGRTRSHFADDPGGTEGPLARSEREVSRREGLPTSNVMVHPKWTPHPDDDDAL